MLQVVNLIIGAFFIGLGFLVKANPILIAGYNTMPEEKRKNVDIDGLSTVMKNYMIAMGIALIVGGFVFDWLGWKMLADSWIIVCVLGTMPFMLMHAQRFDRNKRSPGKLAFAIALVLVIGLGTIGFLYFSSQPAEIKVTGRQITISGMFGTEAEITNAELIEELGTIELKTNGFHLGEVYKGHFRVAGLGSCRLFLQSASGPYALLTTRNGEKIVVNDADASKTTALVLDLLGKRDLDRDN